MKQMMEVPSLMFGAICAVAIVLLLSLSWACYQISADQEDYMKIQREVHELRNDRDFAFQRLHERKCR